MKYLDEYRDASVARRLAEQIAESATQPWSIMEICGGQTHAIMKYGIKELLPAEITLLHGPGCPVCVTPLEQIEKALTLAARPEIIFCSFGDMLRVPGAEKDLLTIKAEGGDVRVVYSPLDALTIAQNNPDREVVFFAIGFETTAPANAMAVFQAKRCGVRNFSVLVAHVLVPPAIETLLSDANCPVNGFLAAGHVCAIMGCDEYQPIADRFQVPIVVTGFEPVDILQGVLACVRQLEAGQHTVENHYSRSVREAGNPEAIRMLREVFKVVPRQWRGIGEIPASGLGLRAAFQAFDAELRFGVSQHKVCEPSSCIAGQILQGQKRPSECAEFAKTCTPEHPLGATMVSSEGACAAYYRYRQVDA
ncbi:MAG: hydrogenase expression/formation protein HypD [Rhodothermales bacterium]|jgi:hydrogenase expression/formation protein HypD